MMNFQVDEYYDRVYDDPYCIEYGSSHFTRPTSEAVAQHADPYAELAQTQREECNLACYNADLQPSSSQATPSSFEYFNDMPIVSCRDDQNDFRLEYENPRPRNVHGIRLRLVTDLPDIYRGIFKFGVFNAVQSVCFESIIFERDNLVISAPTGSGKTVLFELAIIQLLKQARDTGQELKSVYMAPTKALCSERFRDWNAKFGTLGVKCCELTGDTPYIGGNDWGDAKNATIIITTGEKWDSLTRRNRGNHRNVLSQVQLFLVDEVHILNDIRGGTLEVVISRMKRRDSRIRFILLSATIPNIEDIASWVGRMGDQGQPAQIYKFGEEFRPCQLTRHVIGIPRQRNQNDFVFAKILDYKLFAILQEYSIGKPILVFCATRKGAFGTAEQMMKEYKKTEKERKSLPWTRPSKLGQAFDDKRLTDLATCGIGVHHAGLSINDRRLTEDLYMKKILKILVCTSTLAVGVNLPAHTVVIKGVRTFQGHTSIEYSDLDIMQMLGRAGRPQFDKEGVAIILCEANLENKYKALVQGQTILESSLHLNLSEFLNSEIGLGTISDIDSAKTWLRSSFLFQRIRKNPNRYSLGTDDSLTWQQRIDDIILRNIDVLKRTNLVEEHNGELSATDYGDIMSKLYIRQSTMALILGLAECATLREILETISKAEELCDSKIRTSEKAVYNHLRQHADIRFELKNFEKTSDKVFLLLQAVLGGIPLSNPEFKNSDSQPFLEAIVIFRHAPRIARAVVEVAVVKKLGAQVKHGLELMRCLTAKAWDDRPIVLRQIEHLGEKSIKILAEHGVTSFNNLRKQSPLRIETLLNRRPPFGLQVLASVSELPQYTINLSELSTRTDHGQNPVEVNLSIECGLTHTRDLTLHPNRMSNRRGHMTAILTLTSDMDLIDFRRIPTKALKATKIFEVSAKLFKPSQSVRVIISSETIAGLTVQQDFCPNVLPNEYPVMDTRLLTEVEADLVGLEDDPDFWNMDIESDLEVPTVDQKGVNSSPLVSQQKDTINSRKLSNGNYECNHSCKDKSKCRHYCCQDGLKDPPQASKKNNNKNLNSSNKRPSNIQDQNRQAGSNVRSAEKQMKKLEEFHNFAHVAQSLGLSEGKRLKITSCDHKSKPPLTKTPRIQSANIGYADKCSPPALPETCEDDDVPALPEACDLLSVAQEVEPSGADDRDQDDIYSLMKQRSTSTGKSRRVKLKRRHSSSFNVSDSSEVLVKHFKEGQSRTQPVDRKGRREPLFRSFSGIEDEFITEQGERDFLRAEKIGFAAAQTLTLPTGPTTTKENGGFSVRPTVGGQEFEDLDAWLMSGSVELI